MTPNQKFLIQRMLQGHYILPWATHATRAKAFRLYDPGGQAVETLKAKTVNSIDRFIDPKIKIWKKGRNGMITLNLSMLARLHGKNTLKVMYKKSRQNVQK